MSYILGGLTLPQPKKFVRRQVEKSVEHLLMFGKTTKRVDNRKEQFILTFQYLTQAQIGSILSQYELGTVLTFESTETAVPIAETSVLMDIDGREYPQSGEHWRENLTVVLTEVI